MAVFEVKRFFLRAIYDDIDAYQPMSRSMVVDTASTTGSEEGGGFVRDAVGRVSVSEKRKNKLDPNATAAFLKIKHGRQASGRF